MREIASRLAMRECGRRHRYVDEMVKREEITMGELPPEMQELHQKLEAWAYSPAKQKSRYNQSLRVAKLLLEVEGWEFIPPEVDASGA